MNLLPALIVTHNPPFDFEQRLEHFFLEFNHVIIVDNGSHSSTQQKLNAHASSKRKNLHLIFNSTNLGMATALNQGFNLAIKMKCEWIVTFDQDSIPVQGMVDAMCQARDIYLNNDKKTAIIASAIKDSDAGITAKYLRPRHNIFFERKHCTDQKILDNISIAITSGSMHNLRVYEQVGPFRDDFFIDYIDTEYCLRVKRLGFNIIAACNAHLQHKLGNQKKIKFGLWEMQPTFHSPIRWYYINRNRVFMIRQYGLYLPYWLLYELLKFSYSILKMLLLEDQKWKKILALIFGNLDGLLGRTGMIPDNRYRILSKVK